MGKEYIMAIFRDNLGNILGVNTADNLFDSTLVAADENGSMIERQELIQTHISRGVSLGQVAASLTGTATKFTVTGIVAIRHLGVLVTTAIPAGANTLKFQFVPTGGVGTADLSTATDTASAALNQLFLVDGVAATGLVKTTAAGIGVFANEHMPIVLGPGAIQTVFSAGAPATGAVTLFVEYEPLVPGAKIA